jgi:hypothetical protein
LKLLSAYTIALASAFAAGAVPSVTPAVSKVQNLFQELQAAQSKGPGQSKPVHFQLSEAEVNEYLAYARQTQPRPGLESVTVKFFPNNYVSSYTVVNFDAVEQWKPGTIPFALRPVLTGKKAIWVDVRFRAQNGTMTFSVEKAYFGSIPIPTFLVEKVIQVVAARQPEKYDTSKPVPLPFGLRRAWTGLHLAAGEN